MLSINNYLSLVKRSDVTFSYLHPLDSQKPKDNIITAYRNVDSAFAKTFKTLNNNYAQINEQVIVYKPSLASYISRHKNAFSECSLNDELVQKLVAEVKQGSGITPTQIRKLSNEQVKNIIEYFQQYKYTPVAESFREEPSTHIEPTLGQSDEESVDGIGYHVEENTSLQNPVDEEVGSNWTKQPSLMTTATTILGISGLLTLFGRDLISFMSRQNIELTQDENRPNSSEAVHEMSSQQPFVDPENVVGDVPLTEVEGEELHPLEEREILQEPEHTELPTGDVFVPVSPQTITPLIEKGVVEPSRVLIKGQNILDNIIIDKNESKHLRQKHALNQIYGKPRVPGLLQAMTIKQDGDVPKKVAKLFGNKSERKLDQVAFNAIKSLKDKDAIRLVVRAKQQNISDVRLLCQVKKRIDTLKDHKSTKRKLVARFDNRVLNEEEKQLLKYIQNPKQTKIWK